MGCGSSREADDVELQTARPARAGRTPMNIRSPQEVQIHLPRNRVNQDGAPIPMTVVDIDRSTLRRALGHVSDFLIRRGRSLTVLAVGGAVNTLYLQTRMATHDVDMFGTNLGNHSRMLLDEALRYAAQQIHGPLGTHCFNTDT